MDRHLPGFESSMSMDFKLKEGKCLVLLLLVLALVVTIHCAPKRTYVSHPVPDWDVVERMGLEPPAELSASQKTEFERAWTSLQEGALGAAAEDLDTLSRRYGDSPEINTALAYLQLRLGRADEAERKFQAALRRKPGFGPAESGYFLVALSEKDEEKALDRIERLQNDFPEHELVDRYAATLRVNVAESRLRSARELARAGRYQEAAAAYLRALEVAPEAGALFLETAEAELQASEPERAIAHARRATELEPSSADAYRVLSEASYTKEDLAGAVEALRTAASLQPGDESIRSRLRDMESELREKVLPPEYGAIPDAERLTREELAALLYVEQRNAFDRAAVKSTVIATDISDSWAAEYIRRTVGAGVLEVYPNHTFQPKAFVNRIDLATALSETLEALAADVYSSRRSSALSEEFPDLVRENVNYPAAALAVSLGLMKRSDSGAFEPQRIVTGAEAVAAVTSLGRYMTP
jgi:tetratricopeptide (TPR) repeat protein